MNSNDAVARTEGWEQYKAGDVVEGRKSETPSLPAPGSQSCGNDMTERIWEAKALGDWGTDGGNNLD